MRGAPQLGHALWASGLTLWVERRLFVRLCDGFCFGTAIRAGQCSHSSQHVLAAVVPDRVEPALRVQAFAQVAIGDHDALLAVERARDDLAPGRLDDRRTAVAIRLPV